jgi:NAD(P)H dehydrogenase (quinone)
MILVTGATGKLGRLVVNGLLAKLSPADVAIAVRDPQKAAEFSARGVSVGR